MPKLRSNHPRAFSLIELIVCLVLIFSLVLTTFQALAVCRRIQKRNEIMTALSLRANTELARLQATEWQKLTAGKRSVIDPKIPDMHGEIVVKDVPDLELKEISIHLSRNPAIGLCEIKISTWRGRQ